MQKRAKNFLINLFTRQTKKIISKHKPIIVAVVGSVGKTSAKVAIATVLAQKYQVLSQSGNYNTPISVPFIFLGRDLPPLKNPFAWFAAWLAGQKIVYGQFNYDIVVVELGTDKPGDIIDFKKLLKIDIAVVTAISEEHMEFFDNLEAVAREELSVAEFAKTLVINTDDVDQKYLDMYLNQNQQTHSYGFDHAEYKISAKRLKNHEFELKINLSQGAKISSTVPLVAEHSIKSYAAAVAVADLLELSSGQIQKGLTTIKPPAGRMQLLQAINNSVIIDDSYNSSPLAAEAAIKTLYDMPASKKIAILGMMNELGEFSKLSHEHIGELCDPTKLDLLVTIGCDANSYLAAAADANNCNVIRTTSPYKAGKVVAQNLTEDTVILVKGSQNGVFAEEAIKQLLANPADVTRLVRQSDFWLGKKQAQFNDFI